MATQFDGFPLRVRIFHPIGRLRGKHTQGWAECDDGEKYLVKGYLEAPVISANEWVCTAVADLLHLTTPTCKVLELADGTLVFGSRIVPNELSSLVAKRLLISKAPSNDYLVPELANNLSKLYALDLLLGNTDRHLFNYLMTDDESQATGPRVARLRAIDFDAADILLSGRTELAMADSSNTISTGRKIRYAHGFQTAPVTDMLSQLRSRRELVFEHAMFGLPPEWLPISEQGRVLDYINSPKFEQTITKLNQGLQDGTYL